MANENIIYSGKAKIVNIGGEPITGEKRLAKLPQRDHGNAMEFVYVCEADDGHKYDVKVEISHRELSGKMLEYYRREDGNAPTQIDVAIRSFVQQGLLSKGAKEEDIALAVADSHIGKEVNISVTEQMKDDGTYWPAKARFVSASRRLTGGDLAARLAAFREGKPAESTVSAPVQNTTNAGIPAPEEDTDMPF